jgi:hypothetical protein
MGHRSIDVTKRYAHLSPANLMAAVAVLEDAQGRASAYAA